MCKIATIQQQQTRIRDIPVAYSSLSETLTLWAKAGVTLRRRAPDSENLCQFKRNPHLETTTSARLNPKHDDARVRIVEETASKVSQTVNRWRLSRCGWVRRDTEKSFGRASRGQVSTVTIKVVAIFLDLRFWNKRVCLSWGSSGSSDIPINVHMRYLWILWWRRVIVCWIVIGCVDVSRIPHFALHNHISHWLRDALPMDAFKLLVVSSHMAVLAVELIKTSRMRVCIC
ncbi:hypothetical protein EI94DRAFT_1748141 [Lactarius quietus]|nr:hypothetical protein EI94DRAFT_1748141 [Lactarius quietus]